MDVKIRMRMVKNVSYQSNGSFALTRNVLGCTFKARLHVPFTCLSQSLSLIVNQIDIDGQNGF